MDDLNIIELYFARDEQAIKETDAKYGKLCHSIAYNILNNNEDSEECVNDTYIGVWNAIPPTRPNNFMLVCDECGWSYKHKVQSNVDYWICSRKGNAGFECSGPNIPEQAVFDAFIRVYNKLRYFEKEVLDSALSMMSDLRTRLITENDEIREIDIEVAKLCEQNNRYERYREKKIMDDVSYMEQTDRLKARLTQLRSRRLKLLSENENEQMIEQLKMLKEIIQDYPKAIVEFDETLFTSIVSKIKVCHDGTLIFELKGQLLLKERIEVSRKCA